MADTIIAEDAPAGRGFTLTLKGETDSHVLVAYDDVTRKFERAADGEIWQRARAVGGHLFSLAVVAARSLEMHFVITELTQNPVDC